MLNTDLVMGPTPIIKGQKNNGLMESRPMGPSVFMLLIYFMLMDTQMNVYLFAFQFVTGTVAG